MKSKVQTLWMPEEAVAQAIRNLIHNGLDASGADGRVRVESIIEGEEIKIQVTDEGKGMTDEVLGPNRGSVLHDQGTGTRNRIGALSDTKRGFSVRRRVVV